MLCDSRNARAHTLSSGHPQRNCIANFHIIVLKTAWSRARDTLLGRHSAFGAVIPSAGVNEPQSLLSQSLVACGAAMLWHFFDRITIDE